MNSTLQKIVVAALAFLIVFGSLCYEIYDKYDERDRLDQDIKGLDDQISAYDLKIAQKPKLTKIKDDIEDNFTNLVEILPQQNEKQGDRVLDDLTSYAAQAHMDPKGVNITYKPAGQFNQTMLNTRWQGTYANTLRFINAMESRGAFLRIDELTLDPVKSTDSDVKLMSVGLKVSTFHYVVK